MDRFSALFVLLTSSFLYLGSCTARNDSLLANGQYRFASSQIQIRKSTGIEPIQITKNIIIADYFEFMDSLVGRYDVLLPYPLTEHLLVRNNPWVMDTLANTDYYRLKARDSFVYDQKQMIVLPKGSVIRLPDSLTACRMLDDFVNTQIDINIPEFTLRIFQDTVLMYSFPVRVGQNRKRYLKFGDRVTDLRTKTGKGTIVDHVKRPDFYNPVDGKKFFLTKRDDGKTTLMPQIPWIETELNGIRYGQLIHPTTNPKTLGKAYSNGCIGTREADAWIIYYYSPIGTKIRIRYDLETLKEGIVVSVHKDIYSN